MKRILIYLIVLTTFNNLSADISVKSFRKLEADLTARIDAPKKDQNGDMCAIIKVVTTETGFSWEPDRLGIVAAIRNVGEYWLYVPFGAKRLTIKHPQLGILRDYLYTMPIEKACVYEMVLTTGKVITTVENEQIITEWVAITSEPSGADVYIDDKPTGKQTPFTAQYPLGEHSYRLNMDLYHPDAGRFELRLDAGTAKIESKLKPNFGQIQLSTLPESEATIKLDGKLLTKVTPCVLERIKSGTHTITLSKPLYHDITETVIVKDNQTTVVKLELKPAFGSLSINSAPEAGATVLLDNETTQKTTPCVIENLPSGTHNVTLRREWYEPINKQITIKDGEKAVLDITMNPIFGTIDITSNPEADIYINNVKTATGNFNGRVNEGIYTIEGRKEKHKTDIQKVQISTGETKTINLTPKPQLGLLEIQSTPINATININGIDRGTTPATIRNLLVGDYDVSLSLANHNTIRKTIKITERDTTRINEMLTQTNTGKIESNEPIKIKPTDNSKLLFSVGALIPLLLNADWSLVDKELGGCFRIGYAKTVGPYVKISTNFSSTIADYTTQNLPNTYYINPAETTTSSYNRFGIAGGLMYNIKPVTLFAGGGWGKYNHFVTTNLYNYLDDSLVKSIQLNTISKNGFETDAGIIFNINKVGLSIGVSSIAFSYMELNIGLCLNL
jgi:hypothetical protein